MTPVQLLDNVKARFYALLHNESEVLSQLLKTALGAYQDRAGVSERIKIKAVDKDNEQEVSFLVPDDFLARVIVKDKTGNYVSANYDRRAKRMIVDSKRYYLPLTFDYLVNLREVDLDNYELQPEIVGLIQDYLEILISIPNSERQRRVAISGNLDVSDIPSESDLFTRKTALEERMSSARCALPMISIQP